MTTVTRFAPSPTGNIHIGNARTALINWIFSRQHEGRFILRYDDTDIERSRKEYADGIARDLEWLGIFPDRVERQSARFETYGEATEKLKAEGLLYPCYETAEELDRQRKRQAMRGLPPIYNRVALNYSQDDLDRFEKENRQPHWRFLLPNFADNPGETQRTEVTWSDLVRGEQTVDLASMSDPVLIREDRTWLYTLPSVVDDIEMGVTHVIRGDDHVTNTGTQIAIFCALGSEPPTFGHHNLLMNASGEGLSKRLGSLSLHSLAKDNYEPMAIASLATLIGTSVAVEAMHSMSDLVQHFDIAKITKSAAKFDVAELDQLNAKIVHGLPFAAVKHRLEAVSVDGGEPFWNAVRANLSKVEEAAFWWQKVESAVPVIDPEDEDFVNTACELLPDEPWNADTWKLWTDAVKKETGRKGRALFMPLRKALTGEEHGPELGPMLPIIGREKTLARLS